MPYIRSDVREGIKRAVKTAAINCGCSFSVLRETIYDMVITWIRNHPDGVRYSTYNAALGVVGCSLAELRRRLLSSAPKQVPTKQGCPLDKDASIRENAIAEAILRCGSSPGNLNYAITALMHFFIKYHFSGFSKFTIESVGNQLSQVSNDLLSKEIFPYEDKKCEENGDIGILE